MKLKNILLATGGLAGLAYLAITPAPNYNKKFDTLVKVPVYNSTMLWDIYKQQDENGHSLPASDVSWTEFSYDALHANKVKKTRALEKIAKQDGEIYMPKEDVNPKFQD